MYAKKREYSRTAHVRSTAPALYPGMVAEPVCAVCKQPIPRPERGTLGDFPFCSARCRAVDLSYWLEGDYAIPDDEWGDALSFDDEPRDPS